MTKILACNDDVTLLGESLSATLPVGTYHVVVDGFGEETFARDPWGYFTLEVWIFDEVCNQ